MKLLVVFLITVAILEDSMVVLTMSEAQLKAAGKLVRNMCQPKSKVTDEQLEGVQNGNFDGSKKLMCYIDCCYQTFKVMKSGQLDYDGAVAQIEQMPENKKEIIRAAFAVCKDKAIGNQKCEASYNLAKCIYDHNPDAFLLP